jgi:hypothetical protein
MVEETEWDKGFLHVFYMGSLDRPLPREATTFSLSDWISAMAPSWRGPFKSDSRW